MRPCRNRDPAQRLKVEDRRVIVVAGGAPEKGNIIPVYTGTCQPVGV
jgi:hypothetical protein